MNDRDNGDRVVNVRLSEIVTSVFDELRRRRIMLWILCFVFLLILFTWTTLLISSGSLSDANPFLNVKSLLNSTNNHYTLPYLFNSTQIPNTHQQQHVFNTSDDFNGLIIGACPKDYALGTIELLCNAFPKKYNVKLIVDPKPNQHIDVKIQSVYGRCTNPITYRRRLQRDPFLSVKVKEIQIYMEPQPRPSRKLTHQLILHTSSPEIDGFSPELESNSDILHVPYALFHFGERTAFKVEDLITLRKNIDFNATEILSKKSGFAVFAARRCAMEEHVFQYGVMRMNLVNELSSKYKKVDSIGACNRNTSPRKDPPAELNNNRDLAVWWYGTYKFSMAAENTERKGYITEKIVNSYLANTIPIYYGTPDIEMYVNKQAIVHCRPNENGSFQECIEEIRELDLNDDLYVKKLQEPLFIENVIPDWMRFDVLAEKILERIMEVKAVPGHLTTELEIKHG